ncbi:unnamed protein product [Closterium sp. Naga37s-1]|nr:unnamed protein product [Closterium sp. Naga37s-1]
MASQSPHKRVRASHNPHWRVLAASVLLALLLFAPPVPARTMDAADDGGHGGGDHEIPSQGKLTSRDVSISSKRALRKKLKKFVDPLPVPPVVNADRLPKDSSGAADLTITAFSVKRKFHRDLPLTRTYAFGLTRKSASVPGPTIMARVGAPLHVTWQNNITDQQHIMPVDYTLMAPKLKKGGVPITVHLHGAQVSSSYDGHPEAWYTHWGEKGPHPHPVSDGSSSTTNGTSITFPFLQIASEAGYLNRPVFLRRITLAPGERACIIVDFSQLPAGTTIRVKNRAAAPYPGGDLPTGDLQYVMQFNVEGDPVADPSTVPARLNSIPLLNLKNIAATREVTLSEMEDKATEEPLMGMIDMKHFNEKVDITPTYRTRELWYLINLTEDAHPIHIHFTPHRILFRRPFNKGLYETRKCSIPAGTCFTGPAISPRRNERGMKDTTRAPPGYVTALVVDFSPWMGKELSFDPTKGPGYMIHCHILDHEDNDMMRPFKILPAK